jgi:hypothetical protein
MVIVSVAVGVSSESARHSVKWLLHCNSTRPHNR